MNFGMPIVGKALRIHYIFELHRPNIFHSCITFQRLIVVLQALLGIVLKEVTDLAFQVTNYHISSMIRI